MPSFVLIASNKATASSPPTVRDAPTFSHLVSGVKRLRNASRISGTVAHSRKKVSTSSIASFILSLPSYASPTPPYGMALRVMRSEEHTSELQSLMRISYAVFCLKKKKILYRQNNKINIL